MVLYAKKQSLSTKNISKTLAEWLTQRTKNLSGQNEYIAVIKVLTVTDQTLKNINRRLVALYGESSTAYGTVNVGNGVSMW